MSFPTLISSRLNLYRQQTVNVIKQQKRQRSSGSGPPFSGVELPNEVFALPVWIAISFSTGPLVFSRLHGKYCEKVDFSHAVQLAIINVTKRGSCWFVESKTGNEFIQIRGQFSRLKRASAVYYVNQRLVNVLVAFLGQSICFLLKL